MKAQCTAITFDPFDLGAMRSLMKSHGNSEFPFSGVNGNSEETEISIFPEKIVTKTFQENGYVRLNTYWWDGTYEETFDGRWKELPKR